MLILVKYSESCYIRQHIFPKKLFDRGNEAMIRRHTRREAVVVVLYGVLFFISLGVVAFGLVMLKIAYDLHHPTEFLAVFFAGSLVVLIGGALACGFCIRVVERLRKKLKKNKKNP
jgi:biotin transporter BioY